MSRRAKANALRQRGSEMNESETRAEHIDPALKAAGWGVVEASPMRREYRIAPGRMSASARARALSRSAPRL